MACNSTYGFTSASAKCTLTKPNTVTVMDAYPNQDYLLIFTLAGIKNPSFVNDFPVVVSSYDSSGTLIEQSGRTAIRFQTQAGRLSATITNLGSDVVGDMTDIALEFTIQNALSAQGYFLLSTPKWNAGTQSRYAVQPIFQVKQNDWDSQEQAYSIPCSSPLHSSIRCFFREVSITEVSQIANARDELKITGLASPITSGGSLKIQTQGKRFRNPPSNAPIATFTAESKRLDKSQVDSQTTGIVYKVDTPYTLASDAVSISTNSGEINVLDRYMFTINLPLPMPVGSTIEITVPPTISIFSDIERKNLVLNSVTGNPPLYTLPEVTVVDPQLQKIRITNMVPLPKNYQDEGNPVVFSLSLLKNPNSTKQSPPFDLKIYDKEHIIFRIAQTGFSFAATPGTLQEIQIIPDNYKVRAKVNYRFSFVTKNSVFKGGAIEITLPPGLLLSEKDLKFMPVQTVHANITFEFKPSTQSLIIKNAFPQRSDEPTQVIFDLIGLQNGPSTKAVKPILIKTLDDQGMPVDHGKSDELVFAANEIKRILTEACADKQTASMTDDVCAYRLKFLIGAEFPIQPDSIIEVQLPEDLKLVNQTLTQTKSSTDGLADLQSKFFVSDSSQTSFKEAGRQMVIIKDAFALASTPNGVDWRQDSFSVAIAGIKSPRSTAPTLSFKARIITSEGHLSYKKEQGVYSNVYQAKEFTITNIKRSNETNGDTTGYFNFTVQLSSRVYKNEYFKITPPAGIEIVQGGDQCTSFLPLQQSLSCTLSNGSLYVLILPEDMSMDSLDVGQFLTFQVRLISNPLTLRPTESFKLYITTSISQDYYVNQLVQGASILNIQPGVIKNLRIAPDNISFGVVTNYLVTFTTANRTPKDSTIQIQFPRTYYPSLLGLTCVPIKASASMTCAISPQKSNILILSNAFEEERSAGTEIGFKLLGIKNPEKSVDQSVINSQLFIRTVAPDGFAIDQTLNPDFSIGCTYPCQTCDGVQTKCTSCQSLQNEGLVMLKLDTQQNTCLIECPPGQYPDAKNVCQPCAYPCERCNTNKDFCDSCLESSGSPYLNQREGKCYQTCPQGFFLQKATRTCEKCTGNCDTCLSQSECITCKEGTYFYEGACLNECPITSILFESSIVKECQKCQNNCYSCEGNVNTCTSCPPGLLLFNKKCLESCPTNYQPDRERNTCYQANEFTLPFITLLMTIAIIVTIIISNLKTYNTRPFSSFLALESAWLVAFWYYYVIFLIKDGHSASTILVVFALVCNYILNWLFYEFLKDRMLKEDKCYIAYKVNHKVASDRIIDWSMVLSFQLFRLTYSGMFDQPRFSCKMGMRQKYFKRMNRYTLFQVTFVFMPIIAANIYNLVYTWPGRQVYWIDWESLLMTTLILICHCIVIFKSEKEYLLSVFNLDENELHYYAPGDKRRKIPLDNETKDLANQIINDGIDDQARQRIKEMTKFQKVGILQAIYDRIFKKKQTSDEKYRLKHGRGQEFNNKHMPAEEEEEERKERLPSAEFTEVSDPYIESRPQKTIGPTQGKMIKMFYSSNQEENKQELAREEERKQKYYEKIDKTQTDNDMTQIDTTNVKRNQQYNALRQDTSANDLTNLVVGDVDEIKMSSVQEFDDDLGHELKVKLRNRDIISEADDQEELQGEREHMGDTGQQFIDSAKMARLALEQKDAESSDSEMDMEMRNFQSAPINMKSAYRGNKPLQVRHQALQAEFRRKGFKTFEYDDEESNHEQLQTIQGSDSELEADNFRSEVWGTGTTKVVEAHYQSLNKRSFTAKKTAGFREPLNSSHFLEVSTMLAKARQEKEAAKIRGTKNAEEREKLEDLNKGEKHEVEKLKNLLSELEGQIVKELDRLRVAEERKRREIDFVENAFYTSNEEGMGVSPGTFDEKNRMPKRPGTKDRSPKMEIPFGDPILQPFADQVEQVQQEKITGKKHKSASRSTKYQRSSAKAVSRKDKKKMSKSSTFMRKRPSQVGTDTFGAKQRSQKDARHENSPQIRERTLSSSMSNMKRQKNFKRSSPSQRSASQAINRQSPSKRSASLASEISAARKTRGSVKPLDIQRVNEEEENEYYQSKDDQGKLVQKVRRKNGSKDTKQRNMDKSSRSASDAFGRKTSRATSGINAHKSSQVSILKDDQSSVPNSAVRAGKSSLNRTSMAPSVNYGGKSSKAVSSRHAPKPKARKSTKSPKAKKSPKQKKTIASPKRTKTKTSKSPKRSISPLSRSKKSLSPLKRFASPKQSPKTSAKESVRVTPKASPNTSANKQTSLNQSKSPQSRSPNHSRSPVKNKNQKRSQSPQRKQTKKPKVITSPKRSNSPKSKNQVQKKQAPSLPKLLQSPSRRSKSDNSPAGLYNLSSLSNNLAKTKLPGKNSNSPVKHTQTSVSASQASVQISKQNSPAFREKSNESSNLSRRNYQKVFNPKKQGGFGVSDRQSMSPVPSNEARPPKAVRAHPSAVDATPKATIGNATVFEGPTSMLTSQYSYSANQQPRGRSLTNTYNQRVSYNAPIEDSPNKESEQRYGRIGDSALRNSGKMILETTNTSKRKTKSKKATKDYSGAYFKHTNFERAVIATNGRAPYNNKELEVITKPEGFDPSKFEFKNDWVNNLISSEAKREMLRRDANQSSLGRESQVAATIYKGQVPSDSMHAPYRPYPEGIPRGDFNKDRPMSGLTTEQMLHDSPISMLHKNPSEAKNSSQVFPMRNLKGAAPELNQQKGTFTSESGSVYKETPIGQKSQPVDIDMPSHNYFNHLDENDKTE